jgi:hypothetical protein
LGETLRVVRGGGGGQGPIVDAVVFGSEKISPLRLSTGAAKTEAKLDTGNSNINEGAALRMGMIKAPTGTFVEAEANKPRGTSEIVEIAGASGGRAVTSSRIIKPCFRRRFPRPATPSKFMCGTRATHFL